MSGESYALHHVFPIEAGNFATAGEASSAIKGQLKRLGVDSTLMRRVAVASYEVELNMVIHSHGGELILEVSVDRIVLTARDVGPGIADIDKAMEEGYSTASDEVRMMGFGAGMGLPNMKRNADAFSIESSPGTGTCIVMGFQLG